MTQIFMALVFSASLVHADGTLTPKAPQWELTERVWAELSATNLSILNSYYDENAVFEDPLTRVQGLAEITNYYKGLYANVKAIRFEFTDKNLSDDQQFFAWTMHLTAPGLNGGKEFSVKGSSLIKFSPKSGKVIYHRDYFDTGEFIYENVPGLKWLHGYIKKSLKK